ncbi:phage holin [Peribacillus frigoritolerans]|uniref:phage holin n=1 Tax=Peribacillus frigoritolerans TaxID=450367 RepID=UPI0024C08F4C|nr:phage holin [Peribacillus frigoritolerans]WHY15762.1 phage holin [Peribacillus frigoritolerans]
MDKTKQYVAMIGGVLGALLLFFQAIGFEISWFNVKTIDAFMNVLLAAVPLAFALYGVYKNQFLLTKKAQKQEEVLKKQGLK